MISKTNLAQSCITDIDCDGSVLLEEDVLTSMLNRISKEAEITVRISNKVSIESEGINLSHAKYDLNHFPRINALPTVEPVELYQDSIDSIVIASQFASTQDSSGSLKCVHMKENYIAATDGSKFFYHKREGLGDFILHPEDISLIRKLSAANLYNGDNYYCATDGNILYSFMKTESGTPNFAAIHSNISGEGIKFTIPKEKFYDYCKLVSDVSKSLVSITELNGSGFVLNDEIHPVSVGLDLPEIEFQFNSRTIQSAINAIPFDDLNFELIKNMIVIKEGDYIIAFNKYYAS